MAKSLKEALLEQLAALQERGLAPGELPIEPEEEPAYTYYSEDDSAGRSERDVRERGEPRRRSAAARPSRQKSRSAAARLRELREPRESREPREPRGKERRESREARSLPPVDLVAPPAPTSRPPSPARPSGGRSSGGPRSPQRSELLRRNAERLQRERAEREEIRQCLSRYAGADVDDAAVETFFSQLAVETGALPPLNVVLEALQNAGTADPVEVGNQVRLHYRRARSRVVSAAGAPS